MFWCEKAASATRAGNAKRFGLITTNSITQTFNRQVIERHLRPADKRSPLVLKFAIPDHPWVDTTDGAAVRVAMTVGATNPGDGLLKLVEQETPGKEEGTTEVVFSVRQGRINADLSCGSDVTAAIPLRSNTGICFQGMNLVGGGFRVDADAIQRLGFSLDALPPVIRRYQKGRELVRGGESGWVIDCFGLTEAELLEQYPTVFQHLLLHVKPERDHNNRASYRTKWWILGEPRGTRRPSLRTLSRYLVTVETSKFKPFVFIDADVIPDHKLYAIASDSDFVMGVLSSRIHGVWALAAGGRLGVGNDPTWTNTTCFLPFPFPDPTKDHGGTIQRLGAAIDNHRKRQQALRPKLIITDMYNVVEKLRSGEALTERDREINEQGLVSVLRELHDQLDAAVAVAYGLPPEACDDVILTHLCALNTQRAGGELNGVVHWLRSEFQDPAAAATQTAFDTPAEVMPIAAAKTADRIPWPKTLPEQAQAVRTALKFIGAPTDTIRLAKTFTGAKTERVGDLLATLASLGQARELADGKYVAV